MEYEYGIAHWRHDPNGKMEDEQGPTRENMTLEAARAWLEQWKNDGGKPDAFYIIRRPKGPWEAVNSASMKAVPEHPSRRIRSRKEIERESRI